MFAKFKIIIVAGVLFSTPAVASDAVDWQSAEAIFQAGRASVKQPPKGNGAAKCAGYWMIHGIALKNKDFPLGAVAIFDSELALVDEAANNSLFFGMMASNARTYEKAKTKAKRLLSGVLNGDARAVKKYFGVLGRCSFGAA